MLREKKVEKKANQLIIIVDESKIVEKLGVGFLPVEVSVEKHTSTKKEITKLVAPSIQLEQKFYNTLGFSINRIIASLKIKGSIVSITIFLLL